jgi:hypothetical protein
MFVNTGVRMTGAQRAKLDRLAQSLNTSRNRVFGMLLDAAEVQAPTARVELQKNNRRDASDLTGQSITAIRA